MRRREGRGTWSRGAPGAWQMAQVWEVRSIRVRRSAGFVENRTSPVRLNMRMRSMPCFSAMVCITWYAASRWSSSMACQVALVIALESWSAPKVIVLRSCPSSVLILTSPETAATMTTITVIESTSFWARRRGITGFRVRNYCCAPRGATIISDSKPCYAAASRPETRALDHGDRGHCGGGFRAGQYQNRRGATPQYDDLGGGPALQGDHQRDLARHARRPSRSGIPGDADHRRKAGHRPHPHVQPHGRGPVFDEPRGPADPDRADLRDLRHLPRAGRSPAARAPALAPPHLQRRGRAAPPGAGPPLRPLPI